MERRPADAALFQKLEEAELSAGPGGKGRNVWTCFGYVLASEQARMVAVHDCDILTYNRELLARLCYPVAHPSLGFDFCKGYYARVTGPTEWPGHAPDGHAAAPRAQEHPGRSIPYLVYMDTFRYPLAGEFSHGRGPGAPRADSVRLGAGGGHAGGGVPQQRAARHLPVRTVRELRPQAPGTLRARRGQGA